MHSAQKGTDFNINFQGVWELVNWKEIEEGQWTITVLLKWYEILKKIKYYSTFIVKIFPIVLVKYSSSSFVMHQWFLGLLVTSNIHNIAQSTWSPPTM